MALIVQVKVRPRAPTFRGPAPEAASHHAARAEIQQPRAEETLLLDNCALAEVYDRTTAKLKFPHDWLELRSYEPCTECGARTGCNQTFLH